MHDMSELERRISAALDRISTHSATLQRPVPTPEPVADEETENLPAASELHAELEAERAVTAQLEERVRAIKEKQDTRVATLESDLSAARNQVAALEEENANLRDSISDSQTNDTATEEQSAENENLRAELEALRAARAAEQAELAELLAHLQPIVEESANA